MECWRKGDIPQRFHYGANPRVPAILCLADPGWMILPGEPKQPVTGGTHGYDNAAPDMAALFIAAGPDIRSAGTLPAFDNVDVEPLLRDLLGMSHDATADGTDAPFREVIRK
jgi:predicted AlkP superfamily pyrophosphatase or phosphodiesterase